MKPKELLSLLRDLYGTGPWPKPLHLWDGAERILAGADAAETARSLRTSRHALGRVLAAPDRPRNLLGLGLDEISPEARKKSRQILGQLLLGRCAELAFEEIYRAEMQTQEFELRDLRESRTDTDYRVYNGQGRPVYRINIKFHGSRFRRAPELVGLEPGDCFALATYKIHSALKKQDEERLPYFFAIVGVPELTGEDVGRSFPDELAEAVAFFHQAPRAQRKRNFEDAVIDHVVARQLPVFLETYSRIIQANWFVLSARKADKLLRELLFDRVYALRIRNFAQQFRGAELDMHFSLLRDLISLHEFLATLRGEGATKVATLLERGEY